MRLAVLLPFFRARHYANINVISTTGYGSPIRLDAVSPVFLMSHANNSSNRSRASTMARRQIGGKIRLRFECGLHKIVGGPHATKRPVVGSNNSTGIECCTSRPRLEH